MKNFQIQASKIRRRSIIFFAAVLTLPVVFFAGLNYRSADDDFEVAKSLELYHSAVKNIRMYYADDVNAAGMIQESISEFLKKLDPYTVYYSESMIENFEFMNTGSYAGIGISVAKRDNKLYVSKIISDSPAQKAGIRTGDYITAVEGHDIHKDNIDFVRNMMQGSVGSQLKIRVERVYRKTGEAKVHSFTVKRERIKTDPVDYHNISDDGIVFIKFSVFTQHSADKFLKALQSYDGSEINGLVIDLRNNPGGFLQEAVNILDLFTDEGKLLVSTKGRIAQWNSVFRAKNKAVFPDLPVAVLVNNSSASASEIVAGTLQDYDRAVILGERTYGKGLVQITRDLGYNTKIKITTAEYFLPGGRCVQALDFSHLRDDGSVSEVPDTLKTPFKTQNGRVFYDGGGVAPDINISSLSGEGFVKFLTDEYIIQDYASKYAAEHDSFAVGDEFSFTEFSDFQKFIRSRDLLKKNRLRRQLDALAESDEAHALGISGDAKKLSEKARNNAYELTVENKETLTFVLEKEIYTRFYGIDKQVIYALHKDPVYREAVKILKDTDEYKKILHISE